MQICKGDGTWRAEALEDTGEVAAVTAVSADPRVGTLVDVDAHLAAGMSATFQLVTRLAHTSVERKTLIYSRKGLPYRKEEISSWVRGGLGWF